MSCGAHGLLARRLPAVAAAGEPHQPALDQEVRARLRLELAPERARAPGRRGVAGVLAVAAADQPRLAAGRGAPVARLELVDERDAHALAREPPRERRAKRPCPDDHHGVHATADATVPRVHALLAAAALLFGHSAEDRPLTATRVGEGPVKVLVVGSIHGNETAGRAVVRRLRHATAGPRGAAVAGRLRQPRRRPQRHAPQRARRRPQPQLRPPLAGRGPPVRHVLPRPRARSPSRSPGPCAGSCGGSGRPSRSGTTSTCGS